MKSVKKLNRKISFILDHLISPHLRKNSYCIHSQIFYYLCRKNILWKETLFYGKIKKKSFSNNF